MSGSDCEIEYLDEDAEIVQHCVQPSENDEAGVFYKDEEITDSEESNLLIERKLNRKISRRRTERKIEDKMPKKRKLEEIDDDYNPTEERRQYKLPKKKKSITSPRTPPKITNEVTKALLKILNEVKVTPRKSNAKPTIPTKTNPDDKLLSYKNFTKSDPKEDLNSRKKLNVEVPDYDDPLCMTGRMICLDLHDVKRLKTWNNLCLDYISRASIILKPIKGDTLSSKRSVVLQNVRNKTTGRLETTIWGKTSVENGAKQRRSDVFQSVLPKFRENRILDFQLAEKGQKKGRSIQEVLLTKEKDDDGDILVAYRPKEALSSVYKFNKQTSKDGVALDKDPQDDTMKQSLKETANCKVCVSCYQQSWRGMRKNVTNNQRLECPVCDRRFTIHNLLRHLKTHSDLEVDMHKKHIAAKLATVVGYLYRCRICQQRFHNIRELRKHVLKHQGTKSFVCEVCNRLTT